MMEPSIEMTPVESSNIAAVGYDAKTSMLRILFKRGISYQYSGVPRSTYMALRTSKSPGTYFRNYIEKQFPGDQI